MKFIDSAIISLLLFGEIGIIIRIIYELYGAHKNSEHQKFIYNFLILLSFGEIGTYIYLIYGIYSANKNLEPREVSVTMLQLFGIIEVKRCTLYYIYRTPINLENHKIKDFFRTGT